MKTALLSMAFLVLLAGDASATSGVNLRWGACFGDGGTSNRTFACAASTGTPHALVGSFMLGAPLAQVSGVEIVVDLATAGATASAWWQVHGASACRGGAAPALSMNGVLSPSAAHCQDWAAGQAAGGLAAFKLGATGPNTLRVIAGFAVPATALMELSPAQEYFAFNIVISNMKTSGANACAGCATPACIVLTSIKVATPPVGGQASRDVTLTGPANGTDSDVVTWQGGAGVRVGALDCARALRLRVSAPEH